MGTTIVFFFLLMMIPNILLCPHISPWSNVSHSREDFFRNEMFFNFCVPCIYPNWSQDPPTICSFHNSYIEVLEHWGRNTCIGLWCIRERGLAWSN